MKCPNCGCEIHDPSFRFCPKCRTKLHPANAPETQPSEPHGQTCPHCGKTGIDPSFRFCPSCRTRLIVSEPVSEKDSPEEKGFLNRLFKTYEKAVKDPAAFMEWAKKNPNDSAVLLAKWGREGKDISMFAAVNPMSEEYRRESAAPAGDKAEETPFEVKKKKNDKEEQEEIRQQTARARDQFSEATGRAADLIKGKAVWNIAPGEVARHISVREFEYVSDNLDGVLIEPGTTAIIYVDGAEVAELSSGLYTFATENVTKEVTEQVIKEEKDKEKSGVVRRTLGRIVRFFMGAKEGEEEHKREERRRRVRTLTRTITARSTVSVYLKADGTFNALFGAVEKGDGKLAFKPYLIPTAHLDVEVGVNLLLKIADFKAFIANYMQGRDSVTISDIQKEVDAAVRAIVRHQLRTVPVDEMGIPDYALEKLNGALMGVRNILRGIEIVEIVDITTDNERFDRFRAVEGTLYTSDRELDYLVRTNEFQNRLEAEKNRQKVQDAKTELDLQMALDEVNKDKLLHDDEMQAFFQHYRNMQAIREAKNDLELEKALLNLKADALVAEDDFEEIMSGLKDKKFDRGQVSEVFRMRSLANTTLAKISIDEDLSNARIRHDANLRISEINAQGDIDDAAWEEHKKNMGRNADEVDLEAAIYGRKIVLEKKQLSDAIALDREQADYRDERRIREADVENEVLDRTLAGERKRKEQAFEDLVRKYEFERGQKADEVALERMRRQVEYDFEKARKLDEAELLERKQRGAMEMMRQMQEGELKKDELKYTHEERIHIDDNDVEKARIRAMENMSEGQLRAAALKDLDAAAQAEYMKAQSSNEMNEFLKKQQEEQKRAADAEIARMSATSKDILAFAERMAQMNANVVTGVQTSRADERQAERETYERIATHRIGEVDAMKEEYRDQMKHEQSRVDENTDKALNYTSRVSTAEAAAGSAKVKYCPICHHELTSDGFCPYCGWPEPDK